MLAAQGKLQHVDKACPSGAQPATSAAGRTCRRRLCWLRTQERSQVMAELMLGTTAPAWLLCTGRPGTAGSAGQACLLACMCESVGSALYV